MDEQRNEIEQQAPESGYTPRPAWQVWLARIGLVIFVFFLVMYYINVLRGGV